MTVEINIELGHKAWKNIKPTPEGHTHDWNVFVQAANGNEIKHFVEKVIFHLPESYRERKHIREEPPFSLSDSTSTSFCMQIDIFFRAGSGRNQECYIYDLAIDKEDVDVLWERTLTFENPSKDFLNILLLSGGKMIDTQKMTEFITAMVKSEAEQDDDIEIIKEVIVETLNSTIEEDDNLQILSNENSRLKAEVVEMKEKTNLQKKLLATYEEKLANCESVVLNTRMEIKQLEEKVEADKKEMSGLKLLVEKLQKELSQIKTPSSKKPEEKIKGKRKRKAIEPLNIPVHVEKKRGNILESAEPVSSSSQNASSTSQNTIPGEFSNVPKSKRVTAKNTTLIEKNSSPRTDSVVNNTSDQAINTNSFLQHTVCEISNLNDSNCLIKASSDNLLIKSENICDDETFPDRRPVKVLSPLGTPGVANSESDKVVEKNSVKSIRAMNKSEATFINCKEPTYETPMLVDSSSSIEEIKNNEVEKHRQENSNEISSSYIPETRNNVIKEPIKRKSTAVTLESINNNVEKHVGSHSVTDNVSLEKHGIKQEIEDPLINNIVEKLPHRNSLEIDGDVDKPIERNFVTDNASLNNFEIKKEIEEPINNDVEKLMNTDSMEVDVSLHVLQIVNDVETPVEVNSVADNVSLVKCKIEKQVDNDVEKLTNANSLEVDPSPHISQILNADVEKHGETNSVANNDSLDMLEIKKEIEGQVNTVVEKLTCVNSMKVDSFLQVPQMMNADVEKSVKRNSVADNISLIRCETKNIEEPKRIDSEKLNSKNSVETNTSLIMPEIKNNDNKENGKKILVDAMKHIEGNSSETCTILGKLNADTCSKSAVEIVNEQPISSNKKTTTKSLDLNCKENSQTHSRFNGKFPLSNLKHTDLREKLKSKRARKCYLQPFKTVQQRRNLNSSTICRPSHLGDISVDNFMQLVSNHCQELSVELNRIKSSEFSKFKYKTNPLFYKLSNINDDITNKYFMRYIRSLTDFFTNPKTSFDMPTIIYFVLNYLSCSTISHSNFFTFDQNQNEHVFLPKSEKCIVSALYEIDGNLSPHLNDIIRNTLNIMHRVIISKKKIAVNGLASMCRVFMNLCRRSKDIWEPLFLCCELLRLAHPIAPYLIVLFAIIWREPFYLHNEYSDEEAMLLNSIIYGMKNKPVLMKGKLWGLTRRLVPAYFPPPTSINAYDSIGFLTAKIVSRCDEGLFENIWILTSPLIIFVLNENWDWKIHFKNEYILPHLVYYSGCLNEQAFDLFCNLYVDIFRFGDESLLEELQKYFTTTALYGGATFVQDCAAIALLKYYISKYNKNEVTKAKHIPASLRDWFLRNKNNPKVSVIVDLYCKKVMESQDYLLAWDDIIMS